MSGTAEYLLIQGKWAAKEGSRGAAFAYLERALENDPDDRQRVEAWLWMAEAAEDPDEKRRYLEYVLGYEPWNPRARRRLALLNGILDSADLVDPDHLPQPTDNPQPEPAANRRYTCPQCGGRLTFTPEGNTLQCDYCGRRTSPSEALSDLETVDEEDLVTALATTRGHIRPVVAGVVECPGCGATFLVAPEAISFSCPYCASSHVLEKLQRRELIPPEAILPLSVSQDAARAALGAWIKERDLGPEAVTGPLSGLYLPFWCFEVGGEVSWRGLPKAVTSGRHTRLVAQVYEEPVLYSDLLVAAGQELSPKIAEGLDDFDLGALLPYAPGYLAGWPAEVYRITVADASIIARKMAWEDARRRLLADRAEQGEEYEGVVTSSGISVLGFKLLLLPFWLGRYRYRGQEYPVAVNGQTGQVRGEGPRGGMRRLFESILKWN